MQTIKLIVRIEDTINWINIPILTLIGRKLTKQRVHDK
jgi:hypothetical protein